MNKQKGSPRFTLASRSERVEAGLAPIYILLGLLIGVVILLVPIPYYRGQIVCDPPCFKDCPPCPQPGWHLGEPIWKRVIDYFVYVNKPDNVGDKMITISASPTPSTSAKTANWKTYTGKFSLFRYPSSWEIRRSDFYGVIGFGPVENQNIVFTISENTYINTNETPDKLANQALGINETVLAKKTTKVDGHYAVIQERESKPGIRIEAYIGDVKSVKNFLPQDGDPKSTNGTMSIYMEIKDSDQNVLNSNRVIFDQILSTFKFTE